MQCAVQLIECSWERVSVRFVHLESFFFLPSFQSKVNHVRVEIHSVEIATKNNEKSQYLESVEESNRKRAKDDASAHRLELSRTVDFILNNFSTFIFN